MIDFETAAVAIPFHRGRRPYEGLAFQFSHHVIQESGDVEHRGQYLNAIPGVFPNYDFLRELKAQLQDDQGTIFRYAAHENTYLNTIYTQLSRDHDVPDRDELMAFIRDIAHPTSGASEEWNSIRDMVDLLRLVKRFYYDPATNGSNSIKAILPAILNSSRYLQERYAEPIYGTDGGIRSLNFSDWTWIKCEGDKVDDPYQLLPKINQFTSDEDEERLNSSKELKEGGAAMVAYARMQFEQMGINERYQLIDALLRYCELDTLAMVMLVEGWKDLLLIRN